MCQNELWKCYRSVSERESERISDWYVWCKTELNLIDKKQSKSSIKEDKETQKETPECRLQSYEKISVPPSSSPQNLQINVKFVPGCAFYCLPNLSIH